MDKPTPLVNSSMLGAYTGQTVRIVGKVQKITGNTLLLQASDHGNVEVALNPDSDISGSTFVEVTGKVSEGGSSLDGNQIREFTTVDCGDSVGKSILLKQRDVRMATLIDFAWLRDRYDVGGERRADLKRFPCALHRTRLKGAQCTKSPRNQTFALHSPHSSVQVRTIAMNRAHLNRNNNNIGRRTPSARTSHPQFASLARLGIVSLHMRTSDRLWR